LVIICPEDQSKLKYIFELYIDTVIRGVHQFIASHAGVFRGARFSSFPTNAWSTEDRIPFPSLANHIVLSKFWKVDLDLKVI